LELGRLRVHILDGFFPFSPARPLTGPSTGLEAACVSASPWLSSTTNGKGAGAFASCPQAQATA
jgi:hypothetical protein